MIALFLRTLEETFITPFGLRFNHAGRASASLCNVLNEDYILFLQQEEHDATTTCTYLLCTTVAFF